MASTYPTSLDAFTNPTTTNSLTSPSHAQQHSDINDAVEALEAKVAIGNTVLGTYTAYTPTFNSLTVGDGTVEGAYCTINNFAHVHGSIIFGSTTAITGSVQINLPVNVNASMASTTYILGSAAALDTSASLRYVASLRRNPTASIAFVGSFNATTTDAYIFGFTSISPMTWAIGDVFTWNLYYRAA